MKGAGAACESLHSRLPASERVLPTPSGLFQGRGGGASPPPSFRLGSGVPLGAPLASCWLSPVPDSSVHLERSSSLRPVQAETQG